MSSESGYFVQSSSPLDSALFFVLAAFILNVIVVIIAFCYFDPSPGPPLISRTYRNFRRLSQSLQGSKHQLVVKGSDDVDTVLFV
uniref:Movement protein n=1 Tax=Angiostrongylus cantonensis TaxID=6313 RepID=A0A0K0CWJ3_ANGCA